MGPAVTATIFIWPPRKAIDAITGPEKLAGLKDVACGCMRTPVILKEKRRSGTPIAGLGRLSKNFPWNGIEDGSAAVLAHHFDKAETLKKRLPYQGLDRLTIDRLTIDIWSGVRGCLKVGAAAA